MNEREKIIHLWFEMWLTKQDLGIDDIFAEDVIYTESWCPKYNNRQIVKHWFQEWNTRGKVVAWEIKQFFHKGNQTIVEWYFKNEMNNGSIEEFDGISLVEWTKDNKIKSLKEFGCNLNNYNPYEHSDQPEFRAAHCPAHPVVPCPPHRCAPAFHRRSRRGAGRSSPDCERG